MPTNMAVNVFSDLHIRLASRSVRKNLARSLHRNSRPFPVHSATCRSTRENKVKSKDHYGLSNAVNLKLKQKMLSLLCDLLDC